MNPTPPKVQAPPPPEWAVKAASEVLGTYWEGRGPPFDREAKASAAIIAKHAPSPAPASEGRSEEMRALLDEAAGRIEFYVDCVSGTTLEGQISSDIAKRLRAAHYPGAGVAKLPPRFYGDGPLPERFDR